MNFVGSRKTFILITAAISATLLLFSTACIHSSGDAVPDSATIAEVGGEVITAIELRRMLALQRASVIDYFNHRNGGELGGDFWNSDYQGEVPAETARARALKEAVRNKIQLKLAESLGIIKGTSYDNLLSEMKRENARRNTALQEDQPVYGPAQFDEGNFMDFYLGRILIDLKERLAENELAVTDKQLREHYELIKDELFKLEDNVRFYKISMSYLEDGIRVNSKLKQAVHMTVDGIKQQLEQGEDVHEIVEEMQEGRAALLIQIDEEHFNNNTARTYFKSLPELYDILANLTEIGQISPVIDDHATGQYVLAVIIGREVNGYRSFEEQKEIVRRHNTDALYEAYLNKLIDEAVVNIDDNYYKITVS